MHFPRLVSTVVLALAASACSDEGNDNPTVTRNANQGAGAGGGGNASGSAAGAGGSEGATPSTSSGGSSAEGPGNPTLSQGGSTAASPGGAAAGAAGSAAMPEGDAGATPQSDAGADTSMSFFVTSRGSGNGGNLGGLAGADALCETLAAAVDPALAAKTWRAYLSTSTENARDRIGTGPWRNAAGAIIANSLDDLHDQAAGGALDATWPVNDFGVPLDETGAQVPQNVHDILTGSQQDGTLAVDAMGNGLTCNDWTATANSTVQIGHSNRAGLAGQPPSWNAVHTVGCCPPGVANCAGGNVTQGGGRGSFYCFAAD